MLNNKTKQQILEEVIKSKELSSSPSLLKLLCYLVECSINNTPATEYAIAKEVFCKDSGFNPYNDTIVRVSVYKLRIKQLKAKAGFAGSFK